jgi:hypothetical protein
MRGSCWLAQRNVLDWTWLRLDAPKRPREFQFRIQHVTSGMLLPIQPRLSTFAKADISVASVTSYIASSGQTTALSFITAQRHSQYQPSRRTDINHELLHPSRILDARANWCVYKSISQLPLDCYLRQPASDRGKCLRGHIIHQTTSERVEHAPA